MKHKPSNWTLWYWLAVFLVIPNGNCIAVGSFDSNAVSAKPCVLLEKGYPNCRDEDGHTLLGKAAAKGHVEVVRNLLGRGADTNLYDNDGRTALMRCLEGSCYAKVKKIMRLLSVYGADFRKRQSSTFLSAFDIAHRESQSLAYGLFQAFWETHGYHRNHCLHGSLLGFIKKPGAKSLVRLYKSKGALGCRLLIECGALDTRYLVIFAIQNSIRELLCLACECGVDLDRVYCDAEIAAKGLGSECRGLTPFMCTAVGGTVAMFEQLLRLGVDSAHSVRLGSDRRDAMELAIDKAAAHCRYTLEKPAGFYLGPSLYWNSLAQDRIYFLAGHGVITEEQRHRLRLLANGDQAEIYHAGLSRTRTLTHAQQYFIQAFKPVQARVSRLIMSRYTCFMQRCGRDITGLIRIFEMGRAKKVTHDLRG